MPWRIQYICYEKDQWPSDHTLLFWKRLTVKSILDNPDICSKWLVCRLEIAALDQPWTQAKDKNCVGSENL